jgi:hypothetical protein
MKCLIIMVQVKEGASYILKLLLSTFFFLSLHKGPESLAGFKFIFIIAVLGVHCDIYKSSKIYFSWIHPPLSFSFISSLPHSWNGFNSYHSYTLSLFPPLSTRTYSADRTCSAFLFSAFIKQWQFFFCLK